MSDVHVRQIAVSGATGGIGRMIAEGFVAQGATVYICGRDAARAEVAAAEVQTIGPGRCRGFGADLASVEGTSAFAEAIGRETDRLHVLVNNAGTLCDAPIDDYPEEGWDATVELNLKAVFFLTQRLLPLLRVGAADDRSAAVINIGSLGGLRIGPRETYAYAAAKAGVHHLTRSLAKRLGPENITVNAIAPGLFPSAMTAGASEEQLAQIAGQIPRRRNGRPEDIKALACFLASEGASFLSGAVIPLDGAMSV